MGAGLADVTINLIEGFKLNCIVFGVTLLFSLPLGLGLALCSMSRYRAVRVVSKTFVWIVRGTPLLLQIIVVFFVPGLLLNVSPPERMDAAVIAFVINYTAYFSEVYRGGIESIPKGQYEAGQVLGMTKSQIFFKVILLQVVKRIIPPMSNEIITLVKDTALMRVIANKEIIMFAQQYISGQAIIWPLFYSGVFFLLFCGVLTLLFGAAERRLGYFRA
ncbi:MAG: amino acid ABC transporter permease [Clostridiales Family XIII bacterium]|jgi:polar amino acid transport system permease protein|nr:amino acid ABC transporter permease [Clostridiales Family XIII bacterium]